MTVLGGEDILQAITPLDPLLEYMARYDPEYSIGFLGASGAEIDALEALTGIPLPPVYRDFLGRMGHEDCGLDVGDFLSTRLEGVSAF